MAQRIDYASLRAAPWKNGGGSTTEIAIAPAGAGLDGFDWRVSLASIEQSGPFSVFAGIDRTLALVAGAGVTLDIEGGRRFVLSAQAPVIAFAGELAIHAAVGAGPTTDFNVMTRRARCTHRFERRRIAGSAALARGGATTLVFVAEGDAVSVRGAQDFMLGRHDALLLDATDGAGWTLDAPLPATVFVVDITYS